MIALASLVGKVLDRYLVEAELGAGAMGIMNVERAMSIVSLPPPPSKSPKL